MLSIKYNSTFFPVTVAAELLDTDDILGDDGKVKEKTHYFIEGDEKPHMSINKYANFQDLKHYVCPSFNREEDFSTSP